jgi:DNA-binding MarR family transcriptional regulator
MATHTRRGTEVQELAILDDLASNGQTSQRALAGRVGTSVGYLNQCVRSMIRQGYLRVTDHSSRPFTYRLTAAGEHYRRSLRYGHFQEVLGHYAAVERRVRERLMQLSQSGVRRVAFYGAGEVMGMVMSIAEAVGLSLAGAVDDDEEKHGTERCGVRIHAPHDLPSLGADAVIITTFRYAGTIRSRIDDSVSAPAIVWHL